MCIFKCVLQCVFCIKFGRDFAFLKNCGAFFWLLKSCICPMPTIYYVTE